MKITKEMLIEMLIEKLSYEQGIAWFWKNFEEESDSDDILKKLQEEKDCNNYQRWLCENFGLTKTAYNYYKDGEIETKENYKDGKSDGEYIRYFKNGKIQKNHNYKNGDAHGKWIEYYDNGNIFLEAEYKDGKLNGEYIRYFKNGKLQMKVSYKDGKECECIWGGEQE